MACTLASERLGCCEDSEFDLMTVMWRIQCNRYAAMPNRIQKMALQPPIDLLRNAHNAGGGLGTFQDDVR